MDFHQFIIFSVIFSAIVLIHHKPYSSIGILIHIQMALISKQ